MRFETFKENVSVLCKTSGTELKRIYHDNGCYKAIIEDGVVITGNPTSAKVCVTWGANHMAFATL